MENFLIYDDNKCHAEALKQLLEKYTENTLIDVSSDYDTTLELLKQNRYLIIFVDIELESGRNGISFADMIQKSGIKSYLVYITGYTKYYEDIFYTKPAAFIEKPFSDIKVKKVLDIIRLRESEKGVIILSTGVRNSVRINPDDVLYIEHSNRYTVFYDTRKNEIHKFYDKKISEIEKILPYGFLRCHQSFIINMKYAVKLNHYYFTLSTDYLTCEILVSQLKYKKSHEMYNNFLINSIR